MSQLALQFDLDRATERSEEWSRAATGWIRSLAPGDEFSSDTLRAAVGDPAGHGDAIGAITRHALKGRLVRFSGRSVMSTRPAARGRWVRVWIRTEDR